MAVAGLYRRILPSPPAIEFASSEGKQLFSEALQSGTMEGFFKLISYFQTQSEPAYCALASLSMVLNALAIDPGRKWKGPWRWFDESMLDCCEPLEKIKAEGITFGKVEAFHTTQSTLSDFCNHVMKCTSSEDCHLITSYHRKAFKQNEELKDEFRTQIRATISVVKECWNLPSEDQKSNDQLLSQNCLFTVKHLNQKMMHAIERLEENYSAKNGLMQNEIDRLKCNLDQFKQHILMEM